MAAPPYVDQPTEAGTRRPRRIELHLGQFGGKLGLVVIGAGLLLIGIGWNGMAGSGGSVNHVPDLRAQLPWLVSGGILGLAMVVLGAALLLSTSHREDRVRLERKLDELIAVMGRPAADPYPSAPVPRGARVTTVPAGLVVAGAASYHRPDCRLVEGRDEADVLSTLDAEQRGLSPCRVCKPVGAAAAR